MTDTIRVATTKISALELIKLQEAELDQLRGENRQIQEKVQGLEAKVQELEEEVKELQRSQAKNSSNSSKPPSTNGYKKPEKLRSRRIKSGRKPGGQPGHRGYNLSRKENPDFIVVHT